MSKLTIEEVSEKLLSKALKPENFYCPKNDFNHLPNVKVYNNIVLSWNDIIIIHPKTKKHVNITKPNQEDYDSETITKLEHSFNQYGVDLDEWLPAVKSEPVEVDGYLKYLMEWGINRHAVLSLRSSHWAFTPIDIPEEDERDAKMHENEKKKYQSFNPDKRVVDNLYEDCLAKHKNLIDEETGDISEAKLELKIHRAYSKTRTKPERNKFFTDVKKMINKNDSVNLKVKPIKKFDTDAKFNAWNKNSDGSKKYVVDGERNPDIKGSSVSGQYGFISKSGSLERQYDRCLKKAYDRPIDKKTGEDLEPNPRKSFVLVWVEGETPEEIQKNRKLAVKEYDSINERNQWTGADTSFWYAKGFLPQDEDGGETDEVIPFDEIRKTMY
jgi:hypothetical protein